MTDRKMEREQAIYIVAQKVIAAMCADPKPEMWPDITKDNWNRVCLMVRALTAQHTPERFAAAYDILSHEEESLRIGA